MGNPIMSSEQVSEQKQNLRLELSNILDRQTSIFLERGSGLICDHLERLVSAEKSWQTIACFFPFKLEPNLVPLIEKLAIEKTLCFPKVDALGNMDFYSLESSQINEAFEKGNFGIMEPKSSSIIKPEDLDCVFVPGLAFDLNGGRLGRGAGHFDRFLPKTNAARVGVGFSVQMTDSLPMDEFDQIMDYVVTDQQIVKVERKLS